MIVVGNEMSVQTSSLQMFGLNLSKLLEIFNHFQWVNEWVREYFFTSFSAQSWQYRERRKPEAGNMLYSYRNTWRVTVLDSAQYHRQHCILHAFEQFGALHIYNLDDKHPTRFFNQVPLSLKTQSDHRNEPSGPTSVGDNLDKITK